MQEKPKYFLDGDVQAEFPYILFDYYMDEVAASRLSKDEAVKLYVADMAVNQPKENWPL